jgi:hypothetical protein
MKRAEIAQQILIAFSGAPSYPSQIDAERLSGRAADFSIQTNKAGRLNVGRVETTNMLYIAGYQETWMTSHSSIFSKTSRSARS